MTYNPFSAENVAEQSFKMFCEAALIDIKKLTVHVPAIPADLMVGQEIEATIEAEVVDTSSGIGAQESTEKLTLSLVMTGQSPKTGEFFFRVAQRVISWKVADEDFSICWSAPDFNGSRVWFSGDCLVRMDWTEYNESEGVKQVVPMVFANNAQTEVMHPERVCVA